jgi:hypothetical protein
VKDLKTVTSRANSVLQIAVQLWVDAYAARASLQQMYNSHEEIPHHGIPRKYNRSILADSQENVKNLSSGLEELKTTFGPVTTNTLQVFIIETQFIV